MKSTVSHSSVSTSTILCISDSAWENKIKFTVTNFFSTTENCFQKSLPAYNFPKFVYVEGNSY